MTTNLDVETINVIRCSSRNDFQNQLSSIYDQLEKDGFAVLQAWDTSDETFKEIVQFFGHIQDHHNADDSGLVKVKPKRPRKPGNAYERHHAYTTGEILPHTDGSYLDGFGVVEGKVVRINPPSYVIYQCTQLADRGGVSYIIDAQEILQHLWDEEPEHAKVVIQPRTVSYCAARHFSTYSPLFQQLSDERWRVRFRADVMYIEPWAYASVKHVIENYLFNPKFRKLYRLTEGQMLIMDNYRVLHGRDAISSENINQTRLLNKVWIWDASADYVLPLVDSPPDANSFKAYERHHPLNLNVAKTFRPRQTGIKLKSKLNQT
jgi:hypothetical protein